MGHLLGHVRDLGSVVLIQMFEFTKQTSDKLSILIQVMQLDFFVLNCKIRRNFLLVSASTIFNEMQLRRPDLLKLLLEPIATDRRGETPEGMLPYLLIPVFSLFQSNLTVFYQRQYIESAQRFPEAPRLTPEHFEALDLFDSLATIQN